MDKNQPEIKEYLNYIKSEIDLIILYLNSLIINKGLKIDKLFLKECKNDIELNDYLKYLISSCNKIINEFKELNFDVHTISEVLHSRVKKIDSFGIKDSIDHTLLESVSFKLNSISNHLNSLSDKIEYKKILEFSEEIDYSNKMLKYKRDNKIENVIWHQ